MKIAAIALIAAVIAATGGPVYAEARHPFCAAKQHDCGKPARISSCCCGDVGTSRDTGTPARPRIDVAEDVSAAPALTKVFQAAPLLRAHGPVRSSPPRSGLIDLPTLFATLLI